jgi:hypothetical protein
MLVLFFFWTIFFYTIFSLFCTLLSRSCVLVFLRSCVLVFLCSCVLVFLCSCYSCYSCYSCFCATPTHADTDTPASPPPCQRRTTTATAANVVAKTHHQQMAQPHHCTSPKCHRWSIVHGRCFGIVGHGGWRRQSCREHVFEQAWQGHPPKTLATPQCRGYRWPSNSNRTTNEPGDATFWTTHQRTKNHQDHDSPRCQTRQQNQCEFARWPQIKHYSAERNVRVSSSVWMLGIFLRCQ